MLIENLELQTRGNHLHIQISRSYGITYDITGGFKKLPIFGGTPFFGSIFKQNNLNFKLSSAAQPPLTKCVSLSTQQTNSNFGNLVQNTNTVLPTSTYIRFSQYRNPAELIKPQTEIEQLNANRPRRQRHKQKPIPDGSVTGQPSS